MYLADHHIHSCCSRTVRRPSRRCSGRPRPPPSPTCVPLTTATCWIWTGDGSQGAGLGPILTQYQAARGGLPRRREAAPGFGAGRCPGGPGLRRRHPLRRGPGLCYRLHPQPQPRQGGKDFYFLDYTTPGPAMRPWMTTSTAWPSWSIWTAGTRWAISSTPFGICRRSLGILSLWRGTRTACARSSPGWPRRGGPLR